MDYYKLLQLDREPFSNSPDPDYFFQSRQHLGCMQKLELALRLKRGLNVVIGDVGTGKTTLCRQLIRKFSSEEDFACHLILDPSFDTPLDFLIHIHELICDDPEPAKPTEGILKERIKQALFNKGVDRDQTIVLIIDEGQKIPQACVEILREFLNYETNTFKLLQIVIFAQLEFDQILKEHANFSDRVNLLYHLEPMNFSDTCQMVHHRLKISSTAAKPKKLFTLPAMWAIYRSSRGYPRKIIHLCHQSMLALIIQNRSQAGWSLIQSCKKRITPGNRPIRKLFFIGSTAALAALVALVYAPVIFNHDSPALNPTAYKIDQKSALNKFMAEAPMTAVANEPQPAAIIEEQAPAADKSLELPPPLAEPKTLNEPSPDEDETEPQPPVETAAIEPNPLPAARSQNTPTAAPFIPDAVAPVSLGKLIVQPGDTLVGMVHRVYGTYHNRHLRAVIEANPYIEDPNRIEIGDLIEFPSLQTHTKPPGKPTYWVVIEEFKTLPSAMQQAREITKAMRMPLQLVPSWSSQTGPLFQVMVKGYFNDAHAASNFIKALPEKYTGQGYVLSQWPQEAILYSDPYSSGAH